MNWDVLRFVVAFLVSNFLAVVITTVYLHRSKTHQAVTFPAWFQATCKFLLWCHTTIVVKEWVGVHRHHHARADKEGDPHSPWIFGFTKVQFWNVLLYGEAKKDKELIETHTRDIPYTVWDRHIFNKTWLALLTGGGIYFLLLGVPGILGYIASGLSYVFIQSSTVNGLGHYPSRIGKRNYEQGAAHSYNLHWPGVLQYVMTWGLGGEENHNNHHGSPRSAFFAHFPEKGEKDLGGVVIRVLERMGIATKVTNPHLEKLGV